jgi:E3 ubiquitin-protein ligase HECTD2
MSEGSTLSMKSQEEGVIRTGAPRHDSEKPDAVRFDVRNMLRPTPVLQPVLPDSKALLAGHLHDVVSSLADYTEVRQIERSTTVARKSTYQTSPHVNYAELHAYHSILARFTLDINYCLSLLVRKDDSAEKRAEIKDEATQFAAHLLICCLDVILELLTGARDEPTAPQGARYLLMILATPWLLRPLNPLATEYSSWHDAQQGNNKQDICGRYEEEARLLLSQQSPGTRTPSSLRDRILALCIGRIANLPETVQKVFPRWFANMPVNAYVEITRAVQEANTKAIRNIPVQTEAKTEQVKQLHDRRFLSEMIGAANIEHFSEDNENLPWYSKKKTAWKLRTSCHTLQLLVVANDIRNDATARYSAQSGQTRASDDTYKPFPIDYFYTPLLDPEAGRLDISLDFELWDARKGKFTMCQYPFLLTLGTKARILEYDNERRKKDAVRQEWHASKGMSADPYFHLLVRREHIIDDSFKAIRQAVGSMSNVTSKKLRVHFDGEEAVDAGGPQKEWFLILTQKLFSEKLGVSPPLDTNLIEV